MLHSRKDYDRIQDPEGKIGEDEPVFLMRAQDDAFLDAVTEWIKAHLRNGGDGDVAVAVGTHLGRAIAWREKNLTKNADAPEGTLRKA